MSTKTVSAFSTENDSVVAGRDLGTQIRTAFAENPDAVVVFASGDYHHEALLRALRETCQAGVIVGSSSAGALRSACALAIRSREMKFSAGRGTRVSADRTAAAEQVSSTFAGLRSDDYEYRTALVLTDALAGHAGELIELLTVATGGGYEYAGGGARDEATPSRTHVFCGTEVLTDACVALEILSRQPLGVGVQHGWTPNSEPMRVTDAQGSRLISLDGLPAVQAFEAHAARTGQTLDRESPLPFFLHNLLGIDTRRGHRLRVPLSIDADGAITCAADIPAGARVHIMKGTITSASRAATAAAHSAMTALRGRAAEGMLFDVVATRLRLGDLFGVGHEVVESTRA